MQVTKQNNTYNKIPEQPLFIFAIYWVVVFLLYYPATKAGRVGDFPGWVDFINSVGFWDYINRKGSGIPSMYQFTQVITCFFYQFFKGNAWPWHILNVTLQAANALLAFIFIRRLLNSAGVLRATAVSFFGSLLFCVSPHISEVVVWEPAFHYLLGVMLIFSVLICNQRYLETGSGKYAWLGLIIFLLSTFSLEVFYLTPLFALTLSLYTYSASICDKDRLRRSLLLFFLPQVILFLANQLLVRAVYHQSVGHIGFVSLIFTSSNFSKPLKYLFHIFFFGRYFTDDTRRNVYAILESARVLISFYAIISLLFVYIGLRYCRLSSSGKVNVLLFLWSLFSLGLVVPLSFPDNGLSILDRYTYQPDSVVYFFMAAVFNSLLAYRLWLMLMLAFTAINIRYTILINDYWKRSSDIVNKLVDTFPNDPAKKVLLLDLPECLHGVQMVGSRDDGEFRMMYNAIKGGKLPNPVHDVEAFYMDSANNGAHVIVTSDTSARVVLNQWGTWWLYYGFGATSYDNTDFRVNMIDAGHQYEIILKHPATEYLLLYQAGGEWRKVDWNKKNVEQY